MSASPVVKWAGGKRRAVDALLPLVLARRAAGGRYVEPFVGGAAVALSVPVHVPVVASDACAPLVETYRALRDDADGVHAALSLLASAHTEELYYVVRASAPDDPRDAAARFIYLNKAGYNGLYRVNRSGVFNVPCGKRRGSRGTPPGCPTLEHLRDVARVMLRWDLRSGDFEPAIDRAVDGDVVYADPPYDGTFTYGAPFGDAEQRRLSDALRRAARRGVGVVTTNADTPLVRRLYSWADVRAADETWTMAAAPSSRGRAGCVVAVRP